MRDLFSYLKDCKGPAIAAPLLKFLEAIFELLVPLVIVRMVDQGLRAGNSQVLWTSFALLLLFAFLGFSASACGQFFAARAATIVSSRLRLRIVRHLQALSPAQLDQIGSAERLNYLNSDALNIQDGVNRTLRLLLRSPFIIAGALILSLTIDLRSGLRIALSLFLISLSLILLTAYALPRYRQLQKKLGLLQKRVRENYLGARVIRALAIDREEIADFNREADDYGRFERRMLPLAILQSPLAALILNICLILLLAHGAIRLEDGSLTQGQLIALYNYLAQILVDVFKLARMMLALTKALSSQQRLSKFFAMEADDPPVPLARIHAPGPRVEIRQLSLTYPGNSEASLFDVDLTLAPGEHLLLMGETSSGKSTLFKALLGFYPYSGEILIDGRALSAKERLGYLAWVPQQAELSATSLRENLLAVRPEASDDELCEALRLACADFILERPEGLDFVLAAGATNVSGGERQRLSIARALLCEAPLLLLDNCASALDFETEARLYRNLAALPWHPTILEISERVRYKDWPGRIAVLAQGRLQAVGTAATLLQDSDVYRRLYQARFEEDYSYV